MSIVDLVAGTNPGDQAEIDKNRAATLMNVAAAHMGMQAFGEAIRNLNEANRIVPNHPKLLMRRARALTRRGAFEEARADITACEARNVVSRDEINAARAETDAAEREVRRFLFFFSSFSVFLPRRRTRGKNQKTNGSSRRARVTAPPCVLPTLTASSSSRETSFFAPRKKKKKKKTQALRAERAVARRAMEK